MTTKSQIEITSFSRYQWKAFVNFDNNMTLGNPMIPTLDETRKSVIKKTYYISYVT